MGIDLVGPLPISKRGNRYIFVITDHFSKYVEAIAIPYQTAATIVTKLIEEVFIRHDFPKKILTDRGRNFRSELIQELLKQLNIKGLATASYNPEANGITERFNRTLIDMLSMYMTLDGKDWDEHIPYVIFAYKTTIHSKTGYTPYFLNHGRESRFIYQDAPKTDDDPSKTVKRLQMAHQIVRERLEKDKQEREAKNAPFVSKFRIGDLEWLGNSETSLSDVTSLMGTRIESALPR